MKRFILALCLVVGVAHAQQTYTANFDRTDESSQFHVFSSALATPQLQFNLTQGTNAYAPGSGYGVYFRYGRSDSDPLMATIYGTITGSVAYIGVTSNDFPYQMDGWYAGLVLTSSVQTLSVRGQLTVRRSPEISAPGVLSKTYAVNGSEYGPFTGSFDAWPFVQEGSIGALVTKAVTNAGLTAVDWATYDAIADVNIASNNLEYVGSIQFTGTTGSAGTLSWNADDETLDLVQNGATLQVGQELHWHVRADGTDITNGQVVYASGTVGNSGRIKVKPYLANGSIPAHLIIGIATEDIDDGTDGKVTHFGKVRGIPVTFAEDTVLYPSPTVAGGLTSTKPTGTNVSTEIAFVVTSNAVNGTLAVRVHPHDANEAISDSAISNSSLVVDGDLTTLSNSLQALIDANAGTVTNIRVGAGSSGRLTVTNGAGAEVVLNFDASDIQSSATFVSATGALWSAVDGKATPASVSNNVRGGYYGSYTQDVVIGAGATRALGRESRDLVFTGVNEGGTNKTAVWTYYPYGGVDYWFTDGAYGPEQLFMSNGNIQASRLTNDLDGVYLRQGEGADATNAVSSLIYTGAVIGNVTFVGSGITQTDTVFNFSGLLSSSNAALTYATTGQMGVVQGYTNRAASALSSSVWASAESTTGYAHRVTFNAFTSAWATADSTTNYQTRTGFNSWTSSLGRLVSYSTNGSSWNIYSGDKQYLNFTGSFPAVISYRFAHLNPANVSHQFLASDPTGLASHSIAVSNVIYYFFQKNSKTGKYGLEIGEGAGPSDYRFHIKDGESRIGGKFSVVSNALFHSSVTSSQGFYGPVYGDASGLTNFPSILRTIAAETAYNTNNTKAYTWATLTATQVLNYGSINWVGTTQLVIGVDYPTGTNKVWFNGVLNAQP